MIIKINNCIPNSLQHDILATTLNDDRFSWGLINEVSGYGDVAPDQFGFFHNVYVKSRGGQTSNFFKTFIPLIYFIEDKFGIPVNDLLRIRVGLQTKVSDTPITHTPHVDSENPHKVFLYYINNTDGDTLIYNEKFSEGTAKNFTIQDRISPIQGLGVLFDGDYYHSSSSPTQDFRAVITINFN